MTDRCEVLVALLRTPDALTRARDDHWYHAPVGTVKKWLGDHWPPQRIAFYQGKVHGDEEAYSIRYFARVREVAKVRRKTLFPDEPSHRNANAFYYKVLLGPLERLDKPIFSRRYRLVIFIPTTWRKFRNAVEMNDLFDGSPLEDRLWAEFKRLKISAERQALVKVERRSYFLDFAIYCREGSLDVEADGDTYHSDPKQIPVDNRRNNDLQTVGYKVLRFNGLQIREQMAEYCVPTIVKNIKDAGGEDDERVVPRDINPDDPETRQLSLFDD